MRSQLVSLIALINEENEVLISLRNFNKKYNGFWEYPGGKVEKNESIYDALIREVKEELGITLQETCSSPLAFSTEKTSETETLLLLFTSRKWFGHLEGKENQTLKWIKSDQLNNFKMPPANLFLNSILRDWLR